MSEIQQTPELLLADTISSGINAAQVPVLNQIKEALNTHTETLQQTLQHLLVTKSANQLSEEQLQEKIQPLMQQIADLKAVQEEQLIKKSANVSIGTAFEVQDFDKFQFNTQTKAVQFYAGKLDASEMECYKNQCVEYTKSFASKNPHIQGLNTEEFEMVYKSATPHSNLDMNPLFNAPFILPLVTYRDADQVMGRVATNRLSNSLEVVQPIIFSEGEAEFIGMGDATPTKDAILNLEKIQAAGVQKYIKFADTLRNAASDKLPLIVNTIQTFLKGKIVTKFEQAYSRQGVSIANLGGTIEGIIPDDVNQYQYSTLLTAGGSEQYQIGKLAYIKSGVASQLTVDAAFRMKRTLLQGTRFQIMGTSETIGQFQTLKDTAGNIMFFNGNGGAIVNGLPNNTLGAELIVNEKMPADIAVYGDITGSYCITTCFGGYEMFDRPAVMGQTSGGYYGRMYATAKITNYRDIRILKLAA